MVEEEPLPVQFSYILEMKIIIIIIIII